MRRIAFIALVAIAAVARSHAADATDPAVAAQYRMEIEAHGAKAVAREWRLWRSAQEVMRQQMPDGEIEQWQRDGGTLIHRRLFPDARRGMELQQADLAMLGSEPRWEDLLAIVPTEVGTRLDCAPVRMEQGIPMQTCSGTIDGVRWRVRSRTDLALPVSVERSDPRGRDTLTLVEAHKLAQAPWPQPVAADFDVMDFADLGDHEHDEFARRIERLIGLAPHAMPF